MSCASCVRRPSGAARSWRRCRYSAESSSQGRIRRDNFPVPVRRTRRPAAARPAAAPADAAAPEFRGRKRACASARRPRPGAAAAHPPGSPGTRKAASAGARRRSICRSPPLPHAAARPSRPPAGTAPQPSDIPPCARTSCRAARRRPPARFAAEGRISGAAAAAAYGGSGRRPGLLSMMNALLCVRSCSSASASGSRQTKAACSAVNASAMQMSSRKKRLRSSSGSNMTCSMSASMPFASKRHTPVCA